MQRVAVFSLFSFLFSLNLSGCGFHLRGTEATTSIAGLSPLRIVIAGEGNVYNPLRLEMEKVLVSQASVSIADAQTVAPTLTLYDEQIRREVLSVDSTNAAVTRFMLKYQLGFHVEDAAGNRLLEPQTIVLLQDYSFDSDNVLANEREEQVLQQALRQRAVQQVLLRLSRIPPNH